MRSLLRICDNTEDVKLHRVFCELVNLRGLNGDKGPSNRISGPWWTIFSCLLLAK